MFSADRTTLLALLALPLLGCSKLPDDPISRPVIAVPADASQAVERLVEGLNSPDPLRRAHAAAQLGRQPADSGAAACLAAALRDENHLVRASAAESLGRLRQQSAAGALIELLNDREQHRDVRSRAAEALGHLQAPEAVEPLIGALNDTVWHVRYQSIIALGRMGDESALPALDNVARYDPEYSLRSAAKQSAESIRGESAAAKPPAASIRESSAC